MRLPRRVPWSSIGELDQVCSWIYSDENDFHSKTTAIHRLSAWKVMANLPHALESTLAILTVLVQDDPQQISNSLFLRQSYATAIIRLVNGLVDPLQLGAYARSIASIAAQLGLPAWLVELRHAVTHEDLPSIDLLREAAGESMSWLLHNYFLPTLNPSSVPVLQSAPLNPVEPILKHYKKLLKVITRDTSLAPRHKADVTKVLRNLERWIAEAKVATNVGAIGWDSRRGVEESAGGEEEDLKERWAIERLCDDLLLPGGLVSLSKKKRTPPADSFYPPASSLNIWAPMLKHIRSLHPTFTAVLASRIVSQLCTDLSPSEQTGVSDFSSTESTNDPLYYTSLARWAMWLVDIDGNGELNKEDIVTTLLTALGLQTNNGTGRRKAADALLAALCAGDPELEDIRNSFLPSVTVATSATWQDGDIDVMNERLNAILTVQGKSRAPQSFASTEPSDESDNRLEPHSSSTGLPRGWQLLGHNSGWKPCPIGVFVGNSVGT